MTDPRISSLPAEGPPLASVIVIGYNQQDFAPLAVASVLAQSEPRLECIFVDDGSADATVSRVNALAASDPRLKVHSKQNGGPGAARNFGAARANPATRFICFLDGDDVLHPDYLSSCIAYLDAHPDVGVVIPSHDCIDPQGAVLGDARRGYRWVPGFLGLPRRLRQDEAVTPFLTFYSGTGVVPFWFGRRDVYCRTEGWDAPLLFFEDVDMLCQLAMVSTVHTIPERLVGYRIHPQQRTAGPPQTAESAAISLDDVQEKWNRRWPSLSDPDAERLVRACIYYRQSHLPFRALWVLKRALAEFLRDPSWPRLRWVVVIMSSFLRDFSYYKLFFWRAGPRYVATRFHEAQAPTGHLSATLVSPAAR